MTCRLDDSSDYDSMIVKERLADEHDDTGSMAIAGARAEVQMAHYLKRAFGDDPLVRVFHDLRLPDAAGGDAAHASTSTRYSSIPTPAAPARTAATAARR